MQSSSSRLAASLVAALALVLGFVSVPTAQASVIEHDKVVSANPSNWTPHALDGAVKGIVEVGGAVVAGGNFTRIATSDRGTELDQAGVFGFDADSGALLDGFRPQISGGDVETVAAHPDGDKVWIGGAFSTVNGVKWPKLALLRLSDGSLVTSFKKVSINGKVLDMKVVGERLIIAGNWSTVQGKAQGRLASLKISNGAFDPFISTTLAGVNRGTSTRVLKFDVTRDGSRLVAIGNFATVGGLNRKQVAILDLSGSQASVVDWSTERFGNFCASAFDTYMRDVDIDPQGLYFVVATTGAYRSGRLCDTASRWELRTTGANLQPSWVNYTGGDTLYSVAITGPAVYIGGHQRWLNNSFASDKPGAGAVEREGIAALDPINGLPLSWNPGRDRGVGAFELTATDAGLWVGSDTDRIGRYEYHGKIAFFPLATGTTIPRPVTGTLPGRLLSLGGGTQPVEVRTFDGTSVGSATALQGVTTDARAATMISSKLYSARSTGVFDVSEWTGSSLGSATTVPDLASSAWRADVAAMTGLYFRAGRLYYTLNGNSSLFYRYFTPESGVIGTERFTASASVTGLTYSTVRGMTMAGDDLYWVESGTGNLRRTPMVGGLPQSGATVNVSGPAIDGIDWRRGPLVLEGLADAVPANLPPVAVASVQCDGLDCTFRSVGSGDPDGRIASFEWDFGDDRLAEGATATHRYAAEGQYTATLTVTDDDGAARSTTIQVRPDVAPEASFTVSCDGLACSFDASASTDGGTPPVAYEWDLGDGSTATGMAPQRTYTADGQYTVKLTVRDDEGSSATFSKTINVAGTAVGAPAQFLAAASATANASVVRVQVPSSVAVGDGLVLLVTGNRSDVSYSAPGAGWTEIAKVSDADVTTVAWQKVAAGSDSGASLSVAMSATTKATAQVLAYRGTAATGPVASVVSAIENGSSATHTTPTAQAPAGSVVVSYWADKSSATTSWNLPQGVTLRSSAYTTGGGLVTAIVADQPPFAEAGQAGGLAATANAVSGKATMLTLVLANR